MTTTEINYATYSDDEPRNKRGQTLAEYIETLRNVHAALKADLFFHMAQKRKATDVASYDYHDKRIRKISERKQMAEKRAAEYGINLKR